MKKLLSIVLGLALGALIGSSSKIEAQTVAPKIFLEGIVSTPANEFGGGLSPDGKSFYFARSVPRSYWYALFVSHLRRGKWSPPEIVPFSGQFRDFDTVFTPDNSKIYFISDRRTSAGKPKTDYDLWYVERTGDDGWSEPRNAGATLNSAGNEWFASVASNGTLYLSSTRGNSADNSDIYRVPLINGKYGEPENLGEAINTAGFETEAYIAPDESFLIFSSIRPGGFGNFDLYVSRNENGRWTKAENLGALVNNSGRDYSPRLSPDGKTLFFTSEKNFATVLQNKPLAYDELQNNLRGLFNGLGNIYQIEIQNLFDKGGVKTMTK